MRSSHSHELPLSRSLEKYIEKENQFPMHNFHTNKEKVRTNTQQMPFGLSKKISEGHLSHVPPKERNDYKINEL